jgi:hypothetical protein
MRDSALRLVLEGKTTIQEAMRHVYFESSYDVPLALQSQGAA